METTPGTTKLPSGFMQFVQTLPAADREMLTYVLLSAALSVTVLVIFGTEMLFRGPVKSFLSPIIHAGKRRRIVKTAAALKKSVETLRDEIEAYKAAIEALIAVNLSDNAQLSVMVEKFKIAAGGLTLSKLAGGKFEELIEQRVTRIHKDERLYHYIVAKTAGLNAFGESYKRFFVKVNGEYIEDLDDLVKSQYHVTQVKQKSEYLTQKNTTRDAERAIRYLDSFSLFIDGALLNAESLLSDLAQAEKDNGYMKLWMRMD